MTEEPQHLGGEGRRDEKTKRGGFETAGGGGEELRGGEERGGEARGRGERSRFSCVDWRGGVRVT